MHSWAGGRSQCLHVHTQHWRLQRNAYNAASTTVQTVLRRFYLLLRSESVVRLTSTTYSGYGRTGRRCDVAARDNGGLLGADRAAGDEQHCRVSGVEFRQLVPIDRSLRHAGLVRTRHPRQLTCLLCLDAAQDASFFRSLSRLSGTRRMSLSHHAGHTTILYCLLLSYSYLYLSSNLTKIHCVRKKSNPCITYDKNAKSERILTKLYTFTSEYICNRTTKFR